MINIWQTKKIKRRIICPSSLPEEAISKPCPYRRAIQLCTGVKVIHFQAAAPSPRFPQEALPAHGHRPWAAAPGWPPSTHHLGLPGRSFHRACPDSSLRKDRKVRPWTEERCCLPSKGQSTTHALVTVSESKSLCPVRPDNTSQGWRRERFSAGPCKETGGSCLKTPNSQKALSKGLS